MKKTSSRQPVQAAPSPALVKRAKMILDDYRLVIEKSPQGGYVGTAIELPGVFGDGQTPGDCIESTRQCLTAAVVALLEAGRVPPLRGRRDVQVNIRLTPEEKLAIGESARREGYRGISEFVRATALKGATLAQKS